MRSDIRDRYRSSGVSASCCGVFACGSRASSAAAPTRVRAASRIGAKSETGMELPCAAGFLRPQSTTSRSGRLPSRRRLAKLCGADTSRHRDMPHTSSLIATIVVGIGLAFILGTIANRLRISPLVGYLLAGVAVGPFTPGFIADQVLAPQLAEIGVILLMFGVGLHFSLKDLLAIRAIV